MLNSYSPQLSPNQTPTRITSLKTNFRSGHSESTKLYCKNKPRIQPNVRLNYVNREPKSRHMMKSLLLHQLRKAKLIRSLSIHLQVFEKGDIEFLIESLTFFPHLKSLKINLNPFSGAYNQDITKLFAKLRKLTRLQFLEISSIYCMSLNHPEFRSLSKSLQKLNHLKSLKIRLGSITLQNSEQDEIRILFSGIKRCKKLVDLKLEFTSFSRRTGQEMSNPGPLIKCLPNLQVLHLSLTGWKKDNNNDLPPALSQLKALKTLNLSLSPHFQLNPQYMASLVSSLKACNNLTALTLEFVSSKDIAQALFSLLKHLKSLKSLMITLQRSKDFLDDAMKELSESLRSLNSLQTLHLELRDSLISNLGIRYLADTFQYLIRLTSFSLEIHQNSTFDAEGIFYLCRKIKALPSLSSLTFRFLHREFDQRSIEAFAMALRNLGQIKNLTLDFNETQFKKPSFLSRLFDSNINETGAFNLLSALSAIVNLSSLSLNLHGFNLKLNELQTLNQSLSKLRKLESIKLELIGNKNSTKDETVTALFRTLRSLPLLASLSLSFSHVNDEDFEYLCIQLEDIYGLYDLNLKFEDLKDVSIMSARQLGLTLGNLSKLSTLNLKISCESGLKNKGAEAILLGLEKLKHLKNLVVDFREGPSLKEIQTVDVGDIVLIQLVNNLQNLLFFDFNSILILG